MAEEGNVSFERLKDDEVTSTFSDISILDLPEPEVEESPVHEALSKSDNPQSKQVEFLNMCNSYPQEQDLTVYYTFNDDNQSSVTHRLGIFKEGFTAAENYLLYEWAAGKSMAVPPEALQKSQHSKIYSTTFKKAKLQPCSTNEPYRVCYMSGNVIKGVSSIFRLLPEADSKSLAGTSASEAGGQNSGAPSLHNDMVTDVVLHDNTVLITSDVASMRSNIALLEEALKKLESEKTTAEEEVARLQQHQQGLNDQLKDLKDKIEEMTCQMQLQKDDWSCKKQKLEEKQLQLEVQKEDLNKCLTEARSQNEKLKESMTILCAQEQTLQLLMHENETRMDEYRAEVETEKEKLAVEVNKVEALLEKQTLMDQQMQLCAEERDKALKEVSQYQNSSAADKDKMEELSEKNEELSKQMLSIDDQQKHVKEMEEERKKLLQELKEERISSSRLQDRLEGCVRERDVSQERLEVLNMDNRALQSNLQTLSDNIAELQQRLTVSEQEKQGAERVAESMSKMQEKTTRSVNKLNISNKLLRHTNKKLKEQCGKLSGLILNLNDGKSVEALVDLPDDDIESIATVDEVASVELSEQDDVESQLAPPSKEASTTSDSVPASAVALKLTDSMNRNMSSMHGELLGLLTQIKEMMVVLTSKQCPASHSLESVAEEAVAAAETLMSNQNAKETGAVAAAAATAAAAAANAAAAAANDAAVAAAAAAAADNDAAAAQTESTQEAVKKEEGETPKAESQEEPETFMDAASTRPSSADFSIVQDESEQNSKGTAKIPDEKPVDSPKTASPSRSNPEYSRGPVLIQGKTAPVFLPQQTGCYPPSSNSQCYPSLGGQFMPPHPPFTVPFVPPPAPPMQVQPNVQSFLYQSAHMPPAPAVPLPCGQSTLPRPLLPEKTDSARHAEVRNTLGGTAQQQAEGGSPSSGAAPANQQQPQQGPRATAGVDYQCPWPMPGAFTNWNLGFGAGIPPHGGCFRFQGNNGKENSSEQQARPGWTPGCFSFNSYPNLGETVSASASATSTTTTATPYTLLQQEMREQVKEQGAKVTQLRENTIVRVENMRRKRQRDRQLVDEDVEGGFSEGATAVQNPESAPEGNDVSIAQEEKENSGEQRQEAASGSTVPAELSSSALMTPDGIEEDQSAETDEEPTTLRADTAEDREETEQQQPEEEAAANSPSTQEDDESLYCSKCQLKFTLSCAGLYEMHMESHKKVKPSAPIADTVEDQAQARAESKTVPAAAAAEEDAEFLHCPMCELSFCRRSVGLFETHIDSHLEHICPVCNVAFQRSMKQQFESHVHSHFDDENVAHRSGARNVEELARSIMEID